MKKSNRYTTLARDTGLFAISSFGSKILMFLLVPLYTNVLSTEEYGIADIISTTVNFLYPILTLAISDATLRFALDKNESKNEVLCTSILFTCASTLILFLLSPIANIIDSSLHLYWIYFSTIYGLFNIHNTLSNYVKGIGKTRLFAIQGIIQTISIIASNILLLLFANKGLEGYLISIIIGYAIPIFVMIISINISKYIIPFRISRHTVTEMLRYSIPMIPTLLAWSVNSGIDKYMITGIVGLSANGIYSVAHKVPTLITTILSVFLQAWQISAIENHGCTDESQYYTTVYRLLNVIGLIGCMIIIAFDRQISKLLFANDYYQAWKYVPLLTIAALFSSYAGFLAAAFRAEKKTNGLFISVSIGAVVNLVLNWILLNLFGTIGAAIATAISFIIVWLIRFTLVQKIVVIRVNVMQTAATYALLLLSAFVYSFEAKHTLPIVSIIFITILALNFHEIKNAMDVLIAITKRKYL